jgi:hypothetical protein
MVDPERLAQLLVELAVMIDAGDPLSEACYMLEGDGPLALYTHERFYVAANNLR